MDNEEIAILRPKTEPAKPSDLLAERARLARKTVGAGTTPQVDGLLRHAARFGVDGIAETAAESGLDEEELTALLTALDEINAKFRRDPKLKALYVQPPRYGPDRRARILLGIPEPDPLAKSLPDEAEATDTIEKKKKEAREGTRRKTH